MAVRILSDLWNFQSFPILPCTSFSEWGRRNLGKSCFCRGLVPSGGKRKGVWQYGWPSWEWLCWTGSKFLTDSHRGHPCNPPTAKTWSYKPSTVQNVQYSKINGHRFLTKCKRKSRRKKPQTMAFLLVQLQINNLIFNLLTDIII